MQKTGETFILRRFDPEDLPEIDDLKKYLVRYSLAPRSGKGPYKLNSYNILSADFCHTTEKGTPNGVLGSVYSPDANNSLADLSEYPESEVVFLIETIRLSQCAVHSRAFANKSVLEWKNMLSALINVVPDVDKDHTTVLMDAFRGSESALEAFNADVKTIICVKHRAAVIKRTWVQKMLKRH